MTKVSPCECGKEVVIDSKKLPEKRGIEFYFYCGKCMTFRTAVAKRKKDVIAAWNKRMKERPRA